MLQTILIFWIIGNDGLNSKKLIKLEVLILFLKRDKIKSFLNLQIKEKPKNSKLLCQEEEVLTYSFIKRKKDCNNRKKNKVFN